MSKFFILFLLFAGQAGAQVGISGSLAATYKKTFARATMAKSTMARVAVRPGITGSSGSRTVLSTTWLIVPGSKLWFS